MYAALLELSFRSDDLEESMHTLHEVLEVTRAFPGCEGVEVLIDVDDPTQVTLIERWATLEDDAAYRVFRAGEGKTTLGSLLTQRATLTRVRSHRTY